MWRKKKLIIPVVIATIVAGSIGGAVFAQTEDGDGSQSESQHGAMLERICEVYQENTGVAIDAEELNDAFNQVRDEMRTKAIENRLQNLVEEGRITEEEASQWLEWWESKPDISIGFGLSGQGDFKGFGGMHHFVMISDSSE